ncbi:MAG: hypothetical protein MHM6MM_007515 [Cercozoa sp. M6MM]
MSTREVTPTLRNSATDHLRETLDEIYGVNVVHDDVVQHIVEFELFPISSEYVNRAIAHADFNKWSPRQKHTMDSVLSLLTTLHEAAPAEDEEESVDYKSRRVSPRYAVVDIVARALRNIIDNWNVDAEILREELGNDMGLQLLNTVESVSDLSLLQEHAHLGPLQTPPPQSPAASTVSEEEEEENEDQESLAVIAAALRYDAFYLFVYLRDLLDAETRVEFLVNTTRRLSLRTLHAVMFVLGASLLQRRSFGSFIERVVEPELRTQLCLSMLRFSLCYDLGFSWDDTYLRAHRLLRKQRLQASSNIEEREGQEAGGSNGRRRKPKFRPTVRLDFELSDFEHLRQWAVSNWMRSNEDRRKHRKILREFRNHTLPQLVEELHARRPFPEEYAYCKDEILRDFRDILQHRLDRDV